MQHLTLAVLAQLTVVLKASPAPGDCGVARASREAQLCRAPSAKPGPSQEEKRTLPGSVCRAEPRKRPAGADPAHACSVADGDELMLWLTPPGTASVAKGTPRLSCLHEQL